ncbi:thioredoxin, mitochondrial [Schistocerca americana]|uniref:thioredoxin, mitochondrial n=1 Tax=Schistocerca americana TaxID=7009 RepID=UPI001F502614|nr:thioredoxin, mitochondrial [Schistocerca americana]XP_049778000.1 thioredoxin, mitochondrial [Schistocerca cancellata]XP_049861232.1 thioredoxin, mitochondrial-like [Schistocerca gregaria]
MQRVLVNISPLLRHSSKESFTAFGTKTTLVRNISVSCNNFNSFKIQDVNDFNERVKNSKVPVIVDFFATWCNPCRMLAPRIESVIAEKKGQVVLAKVDIDEQTDLALDYDVSSVPVLVAIKDGKEEDRLIGLQDVDKLKKFVDNICGSTAAAAAKAS